MSLVNTLPVGANCVFYIHGEMAPENASAAIVTRTSRRGILELVAFSGGTGQGLPRDCVRFWRDPELSSSPEAARRQGCWDYVKYGDNGEPPITTEDIERCVSNALLSGMSPEQITEIHKIPLNAVEILEKKLVRT